MSKKILIVSASPRTGGNSDLLCDQFAKGAQEAGHQVEKIRVREKKIAPCLACYGCRGTGICVQKDDMAEILEKMVEADVLVLATPVYFYSMDGQLKTLIDRTLPRYTEIRDKEVYCRGWQGGHGAHHRRPAGLYRLPARSPGEGRNLRLRGIPKGRGSGYPGLPGCLPRGPAGLSYAAAERRLTHPHGTVQRARTF